MHAMNTQRSIKYRGMAILLGCAIAIPGGAMVLGMGALAASDVATDNRQRIAVTIDEIRAFQSRMFVNAADVDEPTPLNLTMDEMLFLESNLILPGDSDAASRSDAPETATSSYDYRMSPQELQQYEWEREQPNAPETATSSYDYRDWTSGLTDR